MSSQRLVVISQTSSSIRFEERNAVARGKRQQAVRVYTDQGECEKQSADTNYGGRKTMIYKLSAVHE